MSEVKRVIKFRGKRVDNGEWAYGYYAVHQINHGIYSNSKSGFLEWFQVHPETVGQFTGLLDKNGKEGYRKDIVRSGKKLFTIEWQIEEARFWLAPAGKNTGNWKFMDELSRMEIIGNIYENENPLSTT